MNNSIFHDTDFFTKRAQDWWTKWIKDFRRFNVSFDGLWIDMNEPGNYIHYFLFVLIS
jgi:alpha-glucosidase (family GH31 glycosyl hydrolase)